jgi:aminopeptidase N
MPKAEITRSETSERARLLRADRYDISLDLTRGPEVFGSTSVITFDCAEPGASSYADLVAAQVHEISLNGTAIDPATAWADGRIELTGLAARNELRVVADCRYTSESSGLHRSADSVDGKVYTYTCFEPADACTMYANFEQPDLKAAFAFRVTAPAHWTVLSNQPAPQAQPGPAEGTAVWQFTPTPRISTYLTAVCAGDYTVFRDTHTTPGGQVIPMAIACRASLAEAMDAPEVFEVTRQGLDFFSELFGCPYPFEKYDQVFGPEFFSGAVENVGCVVFTEQVVFRSRVTDTMYELRAGVILHEMAHMWFGNLVTMKWWNDLWLNESFAEFSGTLATAEATRFSGAWTTFSNSRKAWGYMQDQLPTTHPIASDVGTLSEAVANFDGISYAKGASVLRQLAAYVGRDQFFAGIGAYLREHGWGNATLAEMLEALEASSGKDLSSWSKAWLETAGPNTLRAQFEVDGSGAFSSFAVLQEAPADHPTLRPHHISIGLYSRGAGGTLERTSKLDIEVTGSRTEVPELTGVAQPDLVLLNDDDLGYVLVRFDERSLATLTESIGDFAGSLPRAVCWSAVIDMVQQAEISLPAYVRMLINGMAAESSVSVLQTLLMVTAQTFRMGADPAWVPAGKEQLATAAERLLRAAEPASDHQLAWAQLLSWTAITPAQLDLIAALLDGSAQVPGLAVDTELRWALLDRLAVTGRIGDEQIDAELARDATDAGRRHAMACRASIPDAGHKAAAWALLTDSDDLGMETMPEVAASMLQPEQAELLTPYVATYFEMLPRLWASRAQLLRGMLGTALFPYSAASPELLQRMQEFQDGQSDAGLVRLITELRDRVERALRSRALPG